MSNITLHDPTPAVFPTSPPMTVHYHCPAAALALAAPGEAKHVPTSNPLHLMFPFSGTFFQEISIPSLQVSPHRPIIFCLSIRM